MKKIKLLNIKGEKTKDINLNEEIFAIEPNDKVLYDAIILGRASLRQGTHKTKTRSEVSGGGRKPWKQKGTGHARQGSIRSVQWRGGGISFGPTPRDYSKKMNRKERRLALKTALTYIAMEDMIAVEKIEFSTPKTKELINFLEELKIADMKVLIVVNELSENLVLASRNLQNVMLMTPSEVNTLDLVNADKLVIDEEAIKSIEEVLS